MIDRIARWWLNRGVPDNHPFKQIELSGMDWRGLPTCECFCGSRMFYALMWLDDDREIGGYVLDGLCSDCGALVTLATPIDLDLMEASNE